MENMSYILFICVVAPMFSLLFVTEKKMRRSVSFLLVGMFVCLFVSEVNGLLSSHLNVDLFYFTTNITPVTEEIVKSVPVFVFAILVSKRVEDLIPVAFFVGIGFAVLENMILLTQNFDNVTLIWSVIRGFASGLMHGMCTGMVGLGISFIRKKRKLFYSGIIAVFDLAIIYHAIFNSLVQAENTLLNYVGFALPILSYIPLVYQIKMRRRRRAARIAGKARA